MRNKGLSYGSFGTSLSMLSSDLFHEEEIIQSLVNSLTKSLSYVIAGSDNSFDTGKLGVGCGLLFLKINKILDSEFDNIFNVSHQQIIEELEFRQGLNQITDISYVLHCLIYFCLLSKSESRLTFSTLKSEALFRDCVRITTEQIESVSSYFHFEALCIIVKEMLTYSKMTNQNRNIVGNIYKNLISVGDNAGYLIKDMDLLRLALGDISSANGNFVQSIINNAAIDTCDYLHYAGMKSLVGAYNLISETFPLDPNFIQDINDLTFLSTCNPSTLMTLRGGYPRQYLYSSKSLKYVDAILL